MTFRAHLTGSPQVPAQQLATFLEDWTSSGAFLTVQAQLLTADDSCTITIASLGEQECNPVTTISSEQSSTTTVPSPPGINYVVIASVIAFVALVMLVIVVIVILIIVLIKGKRKKSIKLQALPALPKQ